MSHNDLRILKFLEEGVFPDNTFMFFDPPLKEYEMIELKSIFDSKNIKDSELIMFPIEQSHHYNEPNSNRLAWLEINGNEVVGWQNSVLTGYGMGYILDNKTSYMKWVSQSENVYDTFIDGRKLLNNIDTEELWSQLYESKLNEIGGKRAKDTHVIYRDPNLVIVVPLSFESAKSFSRGTRYCTGGDCGSRDIESGKEMYHIHTKRGDILFRLFFKNGTKIRLTWDGDINNKDFHWGLGRKDSYPTFSSRNMSNPFDIEQITEIRMEQLELEFELEPRQKKFEEWEKKFARKWGWDSHDISDVLKKIREKWGMPNFRDSTKKTMSQSDWDKMNAEETEVYNTFLKHKKEMLGKYYGKVFWWNDGHEALYRAIRSVPQDAISKMVEYSMSGEYKPITESENDDFDWVNNLEKPKIDKNSLGELGNYSLTPLTINDLKEGLVIKRRTGHFIYELGPEMPLNFKDINTGELLEGEMGFMLINLSNGKRYLGRKKQIIRDFYKIEFQE